MKNTYIRRTVTGGLDWHDISSESEFLKETGAFEIKDVAKTIAKDVYEHLRTMRISTENPGSVTVLANIPSLEEITKNIRDKKEFTVASADGFELLACWKPENNALQQFFYAGQVTYDVEYGIREIEQKNVVYVAIENYLTPMKGIPSIERFYHGPFTDIDDAKREFDRIQKYINARGTEGVRPELLIIDKQKIRRTEWFRYNRQVIRLLEENPQLDTADNFRIQVQAHLETIKEKLAS